MDSDYSALPEELIKLTKIYYPTDIIIVPNDPETFTTSAISVKVKEITLKLPVYAGSKFRFKFKFKKSGGSFHYAQIYKNEVAIGTLQNTNDTAYTEMIEDIAVTDWAVNDRIQLYAFVATLGSCYVKDFRICGTGSEFENTKETYP